MTPGTIDEAVVCLGISVGLFAILALCGPLADYALPHIPFVQRYIDSLPEYEDDTEIAARYEAEFREQAARRWNRIKAAVRKFF